MLQALTWISLHLAGLAVILLSAGGLGHVALRRHPFASVLERIVFTLALGLGLGALALFAIGLAGGLYATWIAGASGVLAAVTLAGLVRALARRRRVAARTSIEHGLVPIALVGLACWLLLIPLTLYPPLEWDSISHHLVLARYFLEDHRIAPELGVPYPLLPALHHMLLVWALAVGDDITAQMIEHVFLVLTSLGLFLWGRRRGSLAFAFALGALPIGQPLMVWLSGTAYLDLEITGFVWLGFYALRVFSDERDTRWWYFAMALFGLSAGVRLQGLFFLAWGGVAGLRWMMPSRGRDGAPPSPPMAWTTLLGGWAIGAATVLPWYLFIFSATGDPVWPALPQIARGIWGSPQVVADASVAYWAAVEPRTVVNFLRLPIDTVFRSALFQPEAHPPLFPLLMLWPLAWIVSFANRSVRWWTVPSVLYMLFWFNGLSMMRYWLPAVPLIGCAFYESVLWLMERNPRRRVAYTVTWTLCGVACLGMGVAWNVRVLSIHGMPPTTSEDRARYLDHDLVGARMVAYVNEHASTGDVVYVLNASWLNYYFRPRVIDYVGLIQHSHWPTGNWPRDADWLRSVEGQGVRWIVINHASLPDFLHLPSELPPNGAFWPGYEMAYEDQAMWVFRRRE